MRPTPQPDLVSSAAESAATPPKKWKKRRDRKRAVLPIRPLVSLTLSRGLDQGSVVVSAAGCLAMVRWGSPYGQSHDSHSFILPRVWAQTDALLDASRTAVRLNDVLIGRHYSSQLLMRQWDLCIHVYWKTGYSQNTQNKPLYLSDLICCLSSPSQTIHMTVFFPKQLI